MVPVFVFGGLHARSGGPICPRLAGGVGRICDSCRVTRRVSVNQEPCAPRGTLGARAGGTSAERWQEPLSRRSRKMDGGEPMRLVGLAMIVGGWALAVGGLLATDATAM